MKRNFLMKSISISLTVAMLMSCMIFGTAAVGAADSNDSSIILDENFDDWTEVSGKDGWTVGADLGIETWYKTPKLAADEGTGKALDISDGTDWTAVRYTFSEAVTDGTLNVSYDLKTATVLGGNLYATLDPTLYTDAAGTKITTGQAYPFMAGGWTSALHNARGSDKGTDQKEIGTAAADTWYTVSISVRPEEATFDMIITKKSDNSVFGKVENLPLEDMGGHQQNEVMSFTIVGAGIGAGTLIDNVKIERVMEVISIDEINIDETFDDWTTVPGAKGWKAGGNTGIESWYINPTLTTEGTSKALDMGSALDWTAIRYTFPYVVTDGTLNVSYDLKTAAVTKNGALYPTLDPTMYTDANNTKITTGQAYPFLNANDGWTSALHNAVGGDKGSAQKEIGTTTADTWYTVDITVRPADSKFDMAVTKKSDKSVLGKVENLPLEDMGGHAQDEVVSFSIVGKGVATGTLIDNVKIEHIPQKPELSESKITMTDISGEQVTGTEGITPGIKTINLDFGNTVAEDSAAENISLTGGTTNPEWTGAAVGSTYIMTLTDGLEEDTKYTLNVSADVANIHGFKLGKEVEVSFTTGKATISAAKATIKDAEVVSDITSGSTLTVSTAAVNTSRSDESLSVIMAYYKDNALYHTELKNSGLANMTAGDVTETFIAPDMTDVDEVKVFVWDNLENLLPYCAAAELSAEAVSNSPAEEEEQTALSEDSIVAEIPYTIDADYTNNTVTVSGQLEGESDFIVLQILAEDVDYDEAEANPLDSTKIFYRNQLNLEDGKYSFTVRYNNTIAAALKASLRANGNYEKTDFDINIVTKDAYTAAAYEVETKAADSSVTDEQFEMLLKDNKLALGLDFTLYDTLSGDEALKNFRDKAKDGLDENNSVGSTQVFNTFVLIQALNEDRIDSIDPYVRGTVIASDEVYADYLALADKESEQKYMTEKLKDADIETLEDFDKAFRQALLLEEIYYATGFGGVKNILDKYGDSVGITGTASNDVYREMQGKDYTAENVDDAYDSLKEKYSSSGNTGGNNKGSGSGSGVKAPSYLKGEYVNPGVAEASDPISVYFNDIDGIDWAAPAIIALADKGIVNGTSEGYFSPNDFVTREQFAKILVGAMGYSDETYSGNVFTDVAEDDWFCSWVNIAYEKGLLKGVGNEMFGTGQLISRQDMTVMLYNAMRAKGVDVPQGAIVFADGGNIADYAVEAVGSMYKIGIINGVSETDFDPLGNATRAQAAKVVYGALMLMQ